MSYQLPFTGDEIKEQLTPAGLEVYLTSPESFAGVQNTWYSVGANVALTGDLQDMFDYVGGSIVYTGSSALTFIFLGTQTIENTGGINIDLEFTLGKNGTPDTKSIQATSGFLPNTPREITCHKVFTVENGDSLDFFVRQTNSATDQQINVNYGIWSVTKTMTLS
jgi:hypothetical protein